RPFCGLDDLARALIEHSRVVGLQSNSNLVAQHSQLSAFSYLLQRFAVRSSLFAFFLRSSLFCLRPVCASLCCVPCTRATTSSLTLRGAGSYRSKCIE